MYIDMGLLYLETEGTGLRINLGGTQHGKSFIFFGKINLKKSEESPKE